MAEKQSNKKPIYDVNWYDDKYQSIVVFRNWMFLLAVICVSGIFAMTMASYYFVPLKSVSPFVIQIDKDTGVTQVVQSQGTKEFTEDEMLIKYFGYKYMLARETYNFRTFQDNLDVVRLMSAPDVFLAYNDFIRGPNGPVKLFGATVERELRLISIDEPNLNKTSGESTVVARFAVTERGAQRAAVDYTMIVTLTGGFDDNFKLTEDQRYINPLGFKVTSYTATREKPVNAGTN